MKKYLVLYLWIVVCSTAYASPSLIPEWNNEAGAATKEVLNGTTSKSTNDRIIEQSNKLEKSTCNATTLWNQMKAWLPTRSMLICLFAYLLKTATWLTSVIGMFMIVYAWYLYAISAFWTDETWKSQKMIKNVIIWIFIISISFWLYLLIDFIFLR